MSIPLTIGGRLVGPGHPCLVVAELSGNHLQDEARAVALVEAAADAGADAVKLQTYTPDTMTLDSDRDWFRVGGDTNPDSWQGRTLYDLYREAFTPWEWHARLRDLAAARGLLFFSTPFDRSAVDFLEDLGVPCHKIASYEVTDVPLLRAVARTGKPVILSIGMADEADVDLAVATLRGAGSGAIAVLHCLTSYTSEHDPDQGHLATIADIARRWNVVAGFSDNNAGILLPVLAVAMGACVVEKHLILRRTDGGPDARFSLEPEELREMVAQIRRTERAVAGVRYGPAPGPEEYNRRFRRSLFVTRDVRAGERFTADNVRCIRPAFGLHPQHLDEVLGRHAAVDVAAGTPLAWEMVAEGDPR